MKAKVVPIRWNDPRVNDLLADSNLLYAALRRDPSLVWRATFADPDLQRRVAATLKRAHGRGRPRHPPEIVHMVKTWRAWVEVKHGKIKGDALHKEIAELMADFYPITPRGVREILDQAKRKKAKRKAAR